MAKVNSGLTALLAAVALAGCSGDASDESQQQGETAPNIVQPGAPGEASRTLTPEELTEIELPDHTEEDVVFVQGMIRHHAQAVRMTGLVPNRSSSRQVKLLARRMDASQRAELEQLRSWLKTRSKPAVAPAGGHGGGHGGTAARMPGMLTDAELAELTAARGASFDRLFLSGMIKHHRGAIVMVERLYQSGGGVEPEVDALARHIDSDQTIEIARMEELLARIG